MELNDASKAALTAAVSTIERGSSAELVIAVRAHSGMLATDLIAAMLAALGTLVFMLFSPWPFSLPAIVFDTIVFGALGAWVCSRFPALRRVLTPFARDNVRRAARAEFFDAGISATRGRTGILVFVSQTERMVEVLADLGVRDAIDEEAWSAWLRTLDARDGRALAAAVTAIAEPLAACLPRAEDDVNELADHVR